MKRTELTKDIAEILSKVSTPVLQSIEHDFRRWLDVEREMEEDFERLEREGEEKGVPVIIVNDEASIEELGDDWEMWDWYCFDEAWMIGDYEIRFKSSCAATHVWDDCVRGEHSLLIYKNGDCVGWDVESLCDEIIKILDKRTDKHEDKPNEVLVEKIYYKE